MITVWGRVNSINVQKVVWVLAESGTPFERKDAGGQFGLLDTDDYGRLNPNRRVPTLIDGDLVIWESNAIVRYVAAKYGAPPLWPADPAVRAVADMWMDWTQTTALPELRPVFWALVRTPEAERGMAALAPLVENMAEVFGRLDAFLADRTYIAGDDFTMGDIPAGAYAWRYLEMDIARPDLPHLEAWFARLRERPACREHVCLPLS